MGEDIIVPSVDVELTDQRHRRRVRFKMRGDCVGEGDMDGDCDVDKDDVYVIRDHRGQSVSEFPGYDIDKDGEITILDALKIKCMMDFVCTTVVPEPEDCE